MTSGGKGAVMEEKKAGVTRRAFIETAAATGAALTIVPRHVLGHGFTPPSDLLNIACVGIGGMGRNNMRAVASQNIVALCDVDWDYAGKSVDRFTQDLERARTPRAPASPSKYCSASSTNSRRRSATPTTARCCSSKRTSTR